MLINPITLPTNAIGNTAQDTISAHYDNIEVDEYKEAQDEETSEPYYSEIARKLNDNNDSVIMKPNISYSTLQMAMTTNNGGDESVICQSNHTRHQV